jgi:ABC-2 type transport system ATP-binding protein
MTAEENLKLVCKIKNISFDKVIEKLELVGLLDRKDSKFKTFSLGMKQRLAIASALLNDPEILILDEPTNGLDPQGIRQIRDLIKIIANQGTTILLASHLLDEVEKVCTHVIVLRNGVSLYQGLVDEMLANNGFFELQSEHLDALIKVISNLEAVDKIEVKDGKALVYLKAPLEAGELNQYLFHQNIVLTHLSKRKISLEEQFLKLTN